MYFTNPLKGTVDPWTTWVWTVWVHLYDIFPPMVSTRVLRDPQLVESIDMEEMWILTAGYTKFLTIQSSATLTYTPWCLWGCSKANHIYWGYSSVSSWKLASLRILNSLRYWKIFNNYYQSWNIVTLELLFLKKKCDLKFLIYHFL